MVSSSGESQVGVEDGPGQDGDSAGSTSAINGSSNGNAVASKPKPPDSKDAVGFTPRGCVAVAMGILASVPFAWLLSHAALLPFYLGLFFYALFGLFIGAIVHRVAAPQRPYSTASVLVGTTLIVLFAWSLSIWHEANDCPSKLAETVSRRTRNIGDRTLTEFRGDVVGQIRDFISQQYPPGGALGFVQWAASSGKIPRGSIQDAQRSMELPHRRTIWLIRVVAAIGLLAFGVGSQTFLLRLESDPPVRRISE